MFDTACGVVLGFIGIAFFVYMISTDEELARRNTCPITGYVYVFSIRTCPPEVPNK